MYFDRLVAFALNYIKQRESAEDLTAELFVKLWLKRETLSQVLRPEVYLFVAIKNACFNLIRNEKRKEQVFNYHEDDQQLEVIPAHRTMQLEDRELAEMIEQQISALPSQRRIIFQLIKEDGLKSSAVAAILGLSTRTVENQLYKAVKSIAEAISHYLGYHPQRRVARKQVNTIISILFF
ncbi:hypothetical protein D9M68_675930 [compost metagenome]